jgi:hypothetical protein
MKSNKATVPYTQEEFLYFILECDESLESIINRTEPRPKLRKSYIYSSDMLAQWTMENWSWAVKGVVACSEYINILYTHPRILEHANLRERDPGSLYSIGHFRRGLPIYNFFYYHCEPYQLL